MVPIFCSAIKIETSDTKAFEFLFIGLLSEGICTTMGSDLEATRGHNHKTYFQEWFQHHMSIGSLVTRCMSSRKSQLRVKTTNSLKKIRRNTLQSRTCMEVYTHLSLFQPKVEVKMFFLQTHRSFKESLQKKKGKRQHRIEIENWCHFI